MTKEGGRTVLSGRAVDQAVHHGLPLGAMNRLELRISRATAYSVGEERSRRASENLAYQAGVDG